jgi:hypothetical protein
MNSVAIKIGSTKKIDITISYIEIWLDQNDPVTMNFMGGSNAEGATLGRVRNRRRMRRRMCAVRP